MYETCSLSHWCFTGHRAKALLYFKFNSMKMGSTHENESTIPDKIYCCEAEKCMQSKLRY